MNDIESWVSAAEGADQKAFRRATHVLLSAISSHANLLPEMVMKGGALLAICYRTGRMTRDVDFSTQVTLQHFDRTIERFVADLDRALTNAGAQNAYGLQLRAQSHEVKPNENGRFPTLHIKIGYATLGDVRLMQRLAHGQSPHVLSVDYSFNEEIHDIERIGDEHLGVNVYGEFTLIAEKLRAYLQQLERDRSRGRDLYDLWCLLKDRRFEPVETVRLFEVIKAKAHSRNIAIDCDTFGNPQLFEHTQRSYEQLSGQVVDLPKFVDAHAVVTRFWRALPW
jgi:predicted nucleotidyltransferase component of viral defense system